MKLSVLSLLILITNFSPGCADQPPQTGHRIIAAAVRGLLTKSYTGIDYLTYREGLKAVEATTAERIDTTPPHLRPQAQHMLAYLRTAAEILQFQHAHNNIQSLPADDRRVNAWLERHPFLQIAIGAHTAGRFDFSTALTLLWDQTNEALKNFQVKSRPL